MKALLNFKGVSLTIGYTYYPGCDDTADTPGVGESVEIHRIDAGGVDIMPLLDDDTVCEIEKILLT